MHKKLWNRLDSYLFSELHWPFIMAMMVYNGIFFIRTFTELAEVAGDVELPFWLFVLLFGSYVPEILYMTVPMSFLFASLAAVSRMNSDSEMMAPQSAGLSYWRISQPVILYGIILAAFTAFLTNWLEPRMIHMRNYKYQNYLNTVARPHLSAGVMNTLDRRSMFYIDNLDDDVGLDMVFINQAGEREHMTFARRVEIFRERERGIRIHLNDGNEKVLDLEQADGVKIFQFNKLEMDFPSPATRAAEHFSGKPHEYMTTGQLLEHLKHLPQDQTMPVRVDLLQRITIPLACIVFSFFAVPIGIKPLRQRRSSGFGASLLIIAVFLLLSKLAKDQVTQGNLPLLPGLWAPTVLFFALGVALMVGKHTWWWQRLYRIRERFGMALHRLARNLRHSLPFRSTRDTWSTMRSGGMSRRHTVAQFPRKLDIYVIRSFVSFYLLIQGSVLTLVLLLEYSQISKYAARNQIPAETIIRYLLHKIPEVLDSSMFFCMLIAVLAVLAVMSKNQEITAIRAAGTSLQRFSLPFIVVGFFASGFSYYMENHFLPTANRTAFSLRNQIKNRNPVRFRRDVWLKTDLGKFLNFRYFDQVESRLHSVRVYDIDPLEGGIVKRAEFSALVHVRTNVWRAEQGGEVWSFFESPDTREFQVRKQKVPTDTEFVLDITAEDLSQQEVRPAAFSIAELREYIDYLKGMGYLPTKELTELFVKMAQPFLPLVMILLAIPLGFQFGRRGSFYGVGVGLILGLSFWLLFEFSRQLGQQGILPPVIAAWTVMVIFSATAIFRFFQMDP